MADFDDATRSPVVNCAQRLLKEELGLESPEYGRDNFRVLSVFLESEMLNISLCGHAVLEIDGAELDRMLRVLPRQDYEFTEWSFVTHEQLRSELFNPTRAYHHSSGYRMLMALLHRYGEARAARMLLGYR